MYKKIGNGLQKGIYILLSLMLGAILVLDLLFQNKDYKCRKEFLLPNIVLLILVFSVCVVISCIVYKKWEEVVRTDKRCFVFINVFSVVLFFILLYVSMNIYFLTDWDTGKVLDDARSLARREVIDGTYYSRFPNQQLLLLIETVLLKINNWFGVIDTNEGVIMIIAFQCLIYSLAGNLLYRVIINYTSNKFYAWTGWVLFCFLLAISGWVTIPYTDAMSIAFPILILWCYQRKEQSDNGKKRMIWWILIAVLSYWGFKMKPTVLIMLIAIVIGEILYGIKKIDKKMLKKVGKTLAVMGICVVISMKVFQCAFNSTGVTINKELNTGALHMVMMGLNNDYDGVWNSNDVDLSLGIANKKERKEVQINTIKQRLSEYGFVSLLRHTARKSLVIFNDGTFAWGVEGKFYAKIFDEKNSYMSPLLRDLFYSTGHAHRKLATMEQALWLFTLFMSGLCFVLKKDKLLTIIVTSLVGIIIFNFLFEARARYVMIYVPVFIFLAMVSLSHVTEAIVKKINVMKSKYTH